MFFFNGKFVKRRDTGTNVTPGGPAIPKSNCFPARLIRNISYPIERRSHCVLVCSCGLLFGQWFSYECAGSNFRLKVTFRMKSRKSDVYSESGHSQVDCQFARGGEAGRIVVESCRIQFIANLAIKLFVECSSEERSNRIISKAMIEWRRRGFLPDFLAELPFTIRIVLIRATTANRKLPSKWSGHFTISGPLTL